MLSDTKKVRKRPFRNELLLAEGRQNSEATQQVAVARIHRSR